MEINEYISKEKKQKRFHIITIFNSYERMHILQLQLEK